MITTTDPQTIRDSLDSLADTYDIPKHEIDSIKYDFDKIVDEYDDRVESLEGECSTLENELDEKRGYGSVEEFASVMLTEFTGPDPNMGEVLSLKDDLEKLLTTKYNISLGKL